jgi:hypothetical protein
MSFIDISDESRLLPDTAESKPPSERLRARELARPPAGGGLRSTQQPARIRHMPRYVIKTINDDGTTGCEAFDGIAENEEAAKDRMAREYGHRDYAGLRDCSGFAGSNDRIVITQEPEPVYIDAGGYQFIIFDRGKLTECMMMWDTDAEAFRTPTHHVSAHLNEDVLALLAKAYSTGLADGSRIGRYAAKAEIRKALEIA